MLYVPEWNDSIRSMYDKIGSNLRTLLIMSERNVSVKCLHWHNRYSMYIILDYVSGQSVFVVDVVCILSEVHCQEYARNFTE